MAEREPVQSPRAATVGAYLIFALFAAAIVLYSARPLLEQAGTDVANGAITDSARLPVVCWCLSWPIALRTRPNVRAFRFGWALGCALALVHITVAFHLGHGWSHAAAWEHTRQTGGYGDGIFVNYAFALVWLVDVAWVWVSPGSYLARPRWLHGSVHGFLAFVVFNAAVVFGSWEMRGLFAGASVFALAWWRSRQHPAPEESVRVR